MDPEEEELDEQEQADADGYVRLKVTDLRKLRKSAKHSETNANEAGQLKREVAILKAGLNLKPRQIEALWKVHSGELTPDALKETASELGFIELEEEEPEKDVQSRAANQRINSAIAGANTPGRSGTLSPEEVAAWPVDKMMRFRKTHPDAWEAIKRGESVPVVGAF